MGNDAELSSSTIEGGCRSTGVWSFETYVPADTLASMTLFATFKLPDHANGPNIVTLNATFCPSWVCTEVPPS